MMPEWIHSIEFHLLRPWWLVAILPALVVGWSLFRHNRHASSGWSSVIDSELLHALMGGEKTGTRRRWPILALLIAWGLATLALSGPCFEKSNQNTLKQADAVVILLDLSPSMLTPDVVPKRIQAAHYKILDLLQQRREGYTALVAYSGSAHVVAPLSDDTNTIAALVSTLEPRIMPSMGSRVEDAVSEALQLLENSHFSRGRLLLLTDGVVPAALENIHEQLQGKSVTLDVIGIGTADGAPIALPSGGFATDSNGKMLMNPLDESTLQKLATENRGYYSPLRTDDKDILPIIAPPEWLGQNGGDTRNASHTIENWQDIGYWLALPCLLLALLFFRRGVLIGLLPLLLLTHHENLKAEENITTTEKTSPGFSFPATWQDWWQTPDQQAAKALERGDAASAAKLFTDSQWKAYAEYQNGQHKEAAQHFSESNKSDAQYNQGNAQAKAGDLKGAIASYQHALDKQPDFPDASFNKALVEKLLQQQEKDQQSKSQENNQDQKQDNDQAQGNNQQGQEQENQDQTQNQDKRQNNDQSQQQETSQNEDKKTGQDPSTDDKNQEPSNTEKDNQEKNPSDALKKDDEKQDRENVTPDEKSAIDSDNPVDPEKKQATEQWLRKVPDDPGGLLKNKFYYYYQMNRRQSAIERSMGVDENEEQRW